jgi:hypothetical protein
MSIKSPIWLTTVIGLLAIASAAFGQEEQWLQYQSSRDARSILKDTSQQSLKLISQLPEGVALPDFKENKPLFYKWLSPMVKKGYLLIAVDCNQIGEGRTHDLLYIDSNADGGLKDQMPVQAYKAERDHSYFGPVKVTFEGEDGPITYHLNFQLCDHDAQPLWASCAGWYEGTITLGGEKKQCVLIDYDANGTFNDKSVNFSDCDRIRIGGEDSAICYVGNYIEVGGELCRLEVARDGACIKIAKAEGVVFGNIRLPETVSEFAAGGENGLFIFKPERGAGRLPVGKYCVEHWNIERKDDEGNIWKLEGRGFGDAGVFDVNVQREAEISIGEPAISTLEAADEGPGGHYFSQNLAGHLRERIELTCNGDRPPAPKLHIKSEDGSYDRTFTFEYG